ncbi:hypothetical protein CHS0354_013059 [Potamilus streckersoni]|uniref:Uncharacterized protein n=1 Tax=Potamilus streckersoni TaxID=2493646 RepID=A0AAE0VMW4_9BIVA|nr:hypothetical protein CHS0354_013059 [Potamilus streckersoni]
MKAVLWTDSFQIGMMFAGLIAVLIKGAQSVGGMSQAWSYAEETGRTVLTDWSPDPATRHSVWALVIGGMFTWIAIYGVNQSQVQRACSCGSLREAQIAMWLNLPGLWGILYLGCLIGITMYAFYRHCDPIQFKLVSASDQLLPLFVMDVMGNVYGIPGLFVACLFSGALSTISSGLNSIAACVLQDVVRAYFYKDMSEERATNASKIIAAVFGLICIGLTYVASLLGGVLQAALSLFGMIGGPLLGVFTLGMIFPWANAYGAYAGLICSLILMFWIGIGTQILKPAIPKSPLDLSQCNWNLTTTAASVTSLVNISSTTVSSMIYSTMELTHNATLAISTAAISSSAEVEHGPLYKLYTLSYIWYSATAVLTTVVIGLIVSFVTGRTKANEMDPRLMAPLFDIIFPFLPEKILKPLRFGVRYNMIKHLESDERHTANELHPTEIDKYFDTEITEKEQTSRTHKMNSDSVIWHSETHMKHDDHNVDSCSSDIGNNEIFSNNTRSSTQALVELKTYRRI